MKKVRLDVEGLRVETFATVERGGVSARSGYTSDFDCTHYEGGCNTHSLNHATGCDCSGGPRCTLACVEYSQATDIQACCG
jgi:hypothetical protein